MKWLKHMANASGNEDIVEIEALFGLEGYARWWKLLEAVALQMDKTDRHSVAYPWSKWQEILKGKRKKLETFLEHLQKKTLISYEQNGEILEIKVPKLLRYRDEYSKKSGHNPEKLRTKDTDTEAEEDTDRTPLPPAGETGDGAPASDVFLTIETKDGELYELSGAQVAEWQEALPHIDVAAELRKAALWHKAAPSRRKTHRGMEKFLYGWLLRDRPSSGGVAQSGPPQMPPNGGPLITTNGGKTVFDLIGPPPQRTELTG